MREATPRLTRTCDFLMFLPSPQVQAFFKCLDEDHVPRLGSQGDRKRLYRLRIQLPPQDSVPYHLTTEEEKRKWAKFVLEREDDALGIARAAIVSEDSKVRALRAYPGSGVISAVGVGLELVTVLSFSILSREITHLA